MNVARMRSFTLPSSVLGTGTRVAGAAMALPAGPAASARMPMRAGPGPGEAIDAARHHEGWSS